MAILTPGFKRTQKSSAFYIESNLRLDSSSNHSSSDLSLGFRIVYRLGFLYVGVPSTDPTTLARQGRKAFMNIFGLDDNHVKTEEPHIGYSDSNTALWSALWQVYWDKNGYLDLRKIRRCDIALNIIAKRNRVVIKHFGTTVMARELSYLQKHDM